MPEGVTYLIAQPIYLQDGAEITGTGTIVLYAAGKFVADGDDVTFGAITALGHAATGNALLGQRSTGGFTGWVFNGTIFDNVEVEISRPGRTLQTGAVAPTGTGVDGVTFTADTEHRNYAGDGFGFHISGTTGTVVVEGAWAHDNGVDIDTGEGLKISARAEGVQVLGGIFEGNTRDGIDCYDGHGTVIDGATIRNNGAYGIDQKWTAFTGDDTFTNCIIEGNALGGIHAAGPRPTITGNTVTNNGPFGIRVGPGSDSAAHLEGGLVQGNTVSGHTQYGILGGQEVKDAIIDANILTGNAINIGLSADSLNCTVTNNDAADSTSGEDISIDGTGHTVTGNIGTVVNH